MDFDTHSRAGSIESFRCYNVVLKLWFVFTIWLSLLAKILCASYRVSFCLLLATRICNIRIITRNLRVLSLSLRTRNFRKCWFAPYIRNYHRLSALPGLRVFNVASISKLQITAVKIKIGDHRIFPADCILQPICKAHISNH